MNRVDEEEGWLPVRVTLGIDLACRAPHVASLADDQGRLVWTGRTFQSRVRDLEALWADLGCDPGELTVVMEPTRNAWAPVAAWFKSRGVKVVLVPTTQSADLRAYYSKHTKNDRLDSALLARLPLLHPEGLRPHTGEGPADPLRRATKQRFSVVTRRAAVFARIDALLELLGPGWYEELGTEYGNASLHLLARYGDPRALLRLGRARLGQFLIRYSHGQWHHDKAEHLLAVAHESIVLWDGAGMDFAQLGADLALEAEQALVFTAQIRGRMSGSPDCTGRPTRSRSPAPPRESGQSWRPRSPPGSVTLTGSAASRRSAPTPAWSPRSPSPGRPARASTVAASPKPATRCCGSPCGWPRTWPAGPTHNWPRPTCGR